MLLFLLLFGSLCLSPLVYRVDFLIKADEIKNDRHELSRIYLSSVSVPRTKQKSQIHRKHEFVSLQRNFIYYYYYSYYSSTKPSYYYYYLQSQPTQSPTYEYYYYYFFQLDRPTKFPTFKPSTEIPTTFRPTRRVSNAPESRISICNQHIYMLQLNLKCNDD